MILYPGCDYYHEKRDDEFAPVGECETCYRYEICKTPYNEEYKERTNNGFGSIWTN